ncbi:MAG: circularly permuted type 2 ATP-grasp protein [Phycisphaerae bacterium]|nr:circularly permuted type 2 ATP-grasp protein [Tepidisphaeraceae bacterium]
MSPTAPNLADPASTAALEPRSPEKPGARGFARAYVPGAPRSDEMLEPDGALRAHWRMLVSMIDDLGPDELTRRWEQARRMIRENGITHNVYGDASGMDRPWSLDLVPLLVPAPEFRGIGDALAQRARLLDRLLADLYGRQESLALGLLPPELVYANPNFLRPLHGVALPQQKFLHLYAADLVRTGNGQLQVLADRTQAPSGAGYTLENRIVLSRVLPTIFRACNVQRLAPFFIALRQTLAGLAPSNRENPRVVLLTPGPYNETYFEHAYLARYLGYTLVQGNDLTVRDCRVYLKTLGGLQRVDVIVRRVDDDFCDPLELYPTSFLGVPGLVQAVREGTVAVANALGSGVIQAPGFLPFLPGLCRHFLGEDMRLPSVRTWWCGERDALDYVLDNLGSLVVKPAFPVRGAVDPTFGHAQSRDQLSDLAARIKAHPANYVAQELAESSTAPVLLNDALQSRRFVVRAYLAADTSDGGYAVMPGGLTRVSGSADSLVVSLQKGGGAKDLWVLGDGPVTEVTLLASASQGVELSRGGADLPSRVADDLFWLGRYVSRAENLVRTARALFNRLMDQSAVGSSRALELLIRTLFGDASPDQPGSVGAVASAAAHAVAARALPAVASDRLDNDLVAALFGPADAAGLRRTLTSVHGLARALRDRIPADAWRILQAAGRDLADFAAPKRPANADDDRLASALELLNSMVASFLAFGGVVAEAMTRGQAWRFLDLGQRLERAQDLTDLLLNLLVDHSPDEVAILDAALDVGDSALTYRRRYLTQLEAAPVVDLLLSDDGNPRAVAFQVAAIEEHLVALPHDPPHPRQAIDRQLALELRTRLRLADLVEACKPMGPRRPGLDELLTDTADHLGKISDHLSHIYFSHATSRRLFPSGQGGGL